jgi:hypothetical protein
MLPESVIAIPDHVFSQKLDDEMVLLNVQTGAYFGLTAVASRAWELVQDGVRPGLVPALLALEFDAPCDEIERDLEAFFAELREKHLVNY